MNIDSHEKARPMKTIRRQLLTTLLILFSSTPTVRAQVPAALGYLYSAQNADGSWGHSADCAAVSETTAQVVRALAEAEATPSAEREAGLD